MLLSTRVINIEWEETQRTNQDFVEFAILFCDRQVTERFFKWQVFGKFRQVYFFKWASYDELWQISLQTFSNLPPIVIIIIIIIIIIIVIIENILFGQEELVPIYSVKQITPRPTFQPTTNRPLVRVSSSNKSMTVVVV